MKRVWLLAVASIAIVVSWCTNTDVCTDCVSDEWNKTEINSTTLLGNRQNSASWAVAMQKPSLEEMENFDAIINWYEESWEKDYTFTDEDVRILNTCFEEQENWWNKIDNGIIVWWIEGSYYSNSVSKDQITVWNTITLTWDYHFDYSKLLLTDEEKEVLSERWWNIVPVNEIENLYLPSYKEDVAEDEVNGWYANSEERIKIYNKIAWDDEEYERNPANTILITNDLLLHSFHKLFDNTLKYYEQTISRNTIKELSQNLFEKFTKLAKDEKDENLKETYEFLSTYWAIPSILLVDKEDLEIVPHYDEDKWHWVEGTVIDDEEMYNIIKENAKWYLAQLTPSDQELVNEILDHIFDANETTPDTLLMSYSPDFIVLNGILQDYTQFVPRSHYTDNAELKTYFMAMKWLMREKFYFGDDKLLNTALIMVNNISDEDTIKLSELSDKIKKLIWWDDDLTLESLSDWMKENNLNSIEKIKSITDEQKDELFRLVPQKIQSTAYSTDDMMHVDSDDAKDMTAGFVFFGEKFTLDSYLFDLLTAGSAEVQFKYMPNKQTALIVPEILENNSDATEIVDLWMNARIAKWDVTEDSELAQYSSYNKVKNEAIEKIKKELENSTIMNTAYHLWLNMLWYLINKPEENAPYFKLDPIYRLKNLVTYMGSYTELKHDTLLYVKQAYAELWWAGDWDCSINVDPPVLPVPKWYIEADIDVINSLIALNSEVKSDFSELSDYVLANYTEFDEFLAHMKKILVQQMNNEIISDEEFEWMRTAYNELSKITFPLWNAVSQKEMRAALIADIFTSEGWNPLYEAVGRPAIMLVMVDDTNWKRVARGPVFTHYEFYDSDDVVDANWSRLNDLQWQSAYDELTGSKLKAALSTLSKNLNKGLKPQE